MLLLFRKYHPLTAVIFLALYCYIAMPVQFWHKHAHRAYTCFPGISAQKKAGPLVVESGGNYFNDCKICAHQYTGYYNDQQQVHIDPFIVVLFQLTFFILSLPEQALIFLPNKGPPSYTPFS